MAIGVRLLVPYVRERGVLGVGVAASGGNLDGRSSLHGGLFERLDSNL